MSTLVVNLDERVKKSPRFKEITVAEHFQNANLKWWHKLSQQTPYQEQEQIISAWLNDLELDRVLELGPGFGRITELLTQKGCKDLTLVEINKKVLKKLSKNFPSATIVAGDCSAYPWYRKRYRTIVAVEILVHIPNIENFLVNIRKALIKDGKAIVSITPTDWYEQNYNRETTIHRGINSEEFETALCKQFLVIDKRKSTNGQLITYLLQK